MTVNASVTNESDLDVNVLLRQFRTQVMRSGILKEMRRRSSAMSRGQRRRVKDATAWKRLRKNQSRSERDKQEHK